MKPSNSLSREVRKVAYALCDAVASPVAMQVRDLIASESWDELSSLKVNPSSYALPEMYFQDAMCISFLRKYEALPTSIDRKAVAVRNFYGAERECYRTNQRLLPFVFNTFQGEKDEAINQFILECRKEVENLIGTRPPANPAGRFGPGATYGDRGSLTTVPDKMQSLPLLTRNAVYFLVPWSGTLWAKAVTNRGESVSFVQGDRFTTVPKDATTDRGITIGPSINVFYQLAYGRAMREALKKRTAGRLDLDTAHEIHKQVACDASITGRSATIDLKQASDHQASALVKLLMPHQWFEPLDDLRCVTTSIQEEDGRTKTIVLEKFSAMGNGYTFELETVIFLAVCCAVMRRQGITPLPGQNVHVYGDDIIVPTEVANDVIVALRYLGFQTNEAKTFVTGDFRESCGGDYFRGMDVRPYFLKKEVVNPQDYIALANGIRRMASEERHSGYRWSLVQRAWFSVMDLIPVQIRSCRGPSELGDLVLHDDKAFWQTRTRSCVRYIKVWRPAKTKKVPWRIFDLDVQLAGLIYTMGQYSAGVTPRGAVQGYKLGWVPYS